MSSRCSGNGRDLGSRGTSAKNPLSVTIRVLLNTSGRSEAKAIYSKTWCKVGFRFIGRGQALLFLISPFCSNQDSSEELAKRRIYRGHKPVYWAAQRCNFFFLPCFFPLYIYIYFLSKKTFYIENVQDTWKHFTQDGK